MSPRSNPEDDHDGEEAPSEITNEDVTRRQIQALQEEVQQLKELLTLCGPQARSPTRARQRASSTPSYNDDTSVSAKSRSPPPPPIHEPNVTKPNKFSGKPSEFLSFMTQCDAIFEMCPKTYAKDANKVLFIITNLEGSALRWARDVVDDKQHPYRKDYQAFRKALFSLYDNRTYRLDAEDKLLSLKQTKSASAYAVEFQTLSAAAGWEINTLCGVFFKGLKSTVKKSIIQQGRADTFEALKEQAIYFDQYEYRMRVEESKESHISNPRAPPQENKRVSPGTPPKSKNPTNDSQKRKRRFAISREEYERRLNLHLCFECGEGGHSAQECKKKKQDYGASNATTTKKRRVDPPKSPEPTSTPPYPPYQYNPPIHHEATVPENWQSRAHKRSEA
jgi:hypothetical protein